ncbi:MAG: hypothetical protein AB8G99_17925, partial [Planctomycetaceae bacterium]
MNVQLKLIHRNVDRSQPKNADTWFIPGSDSSQWLSELLSWNTPLIAAKLYVLSPHGSSVPAGIVVAGVGPNVSSAKALPYRRISERLLIPLEAELFPATTDAELAELLERDSIDAFVWHPAIGIVGYEADEILTVDRLFSVQPASKTQWFAGNTGTQLTDRLSAIFPEQSLTLNDVLGKSGDDIGTEPNLSDAPRSPDESKAAGIRDAVRKLQRPFAQAAQSFANSVPANADKRTWVNAMEDWARRVLQAGSSSMSRRENELKRLLNMLKNDPDKGLRFAIPFSNDNHRGLGQPSDQLSEQLVDYGANSSAGTANYWDMSWEMQQRLRAQYQELALRETRLGRHRRAAYIYSSLLGDLDAAAAVLESGGHYREAAVIYRDKLDQKRKAAECLRKGGQFEQAIAMFESIEDWPSVAGLHEQLENNEAARRAWRNAASVLEKSGDHIKAASLLENKLDDSTAADALLRRGWQYSHKAEDCLKALFSNLARREDTPAATELIEDLNANEHDLERRQAMAASVVATVSQSFPNPDVRTNATAVTRTIVARNLQSESADQRF